MTLCVTPSVAPVAVCFWSPAWNAAVSWLKMIGNRGPARNVPAGMALLKGATLWPQRRLVMKLVSKADSAVAIWVSWIAGSYTVKSGLAPSELAMPALAPVFNGVGSKPPTGMPWAPSEMTRTTSELSSPIRIASWRVSCQISCASGSLVVRGLATLGRGIGSLLLRNWAFWTSLSSCVTFPKLSWGTAFDWSM